MRAGRVVTWFRSAVEGLRSSSRLVWWTTFVLATGLCALWGLADPPFAGPDEPAHVIRAHALDHGQITGETASPRLLRELQGDNTNLMVRAPEVYKAVRTPCFAFEPDVTAECLHIEGSDRDTDALTTAGRHPPAYYAVAGLASLIHKPGAGAVYLMRLITSLIAGALIASALTALQRTAGPTLVAVGLLFAITPMVLFVGGLVNPSAPEIAAAIALWVCGLVLVSQSNERVDRRLVTAVGISACVLTLSRQLSPLWLGLIALSLLVFGNQASVRNLGRSSWARFWAALIAVCTVFQLGWDLVVKPLDATQLGRHRIDVPVSEVVRLTVGAGFGRYREMIGLFGWLDTPAPMLTHLLWAAGIGFLFFLAVTWSKRRHVAVLVGLLLATIIVPIILESIALPDVGGIFWQGRYTLPLAVGIPILSAMATASTERGRQLALRPRLVLGVGITLLIAHVLAFAQNLRRYTVGYNGPIQYWKDPSWSPPVSPLLLTIVYTIAMLAFIAWVLAVSRKRGDDPGDAHDDIRPALSREPSADAVPQALGRT